MSPVGPEEPRVYWIRRGIVIVVLLALVITVIAAVNAVANGDKNAADAPPAGATSPGPSLRPVESSTEPTPTVSGTPTGSASPSTTESGSPQPSETAKPSGSPSSESTSSESKPAESKPAESSTGKPAGPVACEGKAVTVTLDGPNKVSRGKAVTFKVTLTNSGTTECKVVADSDSYELRIYSGTDRIWTTATCPSWVTPVSKTIKPKESVSWTQGWRVVRGKGCGEAPGELRPGTYAANAEFDGAKPDQVVMQLS